MNTEVLRIIEGGLANDHRKIISYANRLADRLDKEGESPLAKCIRQKLETSVPHSAAIADALRTIPLDSASDSRGSAFRFASAKNCAISFGGETNKRVC